MNEENLKLQENMNELKKARIEMQKDHIQAQKNYIEAQQNNMEIFKQFHKEAEIHWKKLRNLQVLATIVITAFIVLRLVE